MATTPELLLHPVRLRIVQAFLGDHELTTLRLRELLPDVATATLYRQVATLAEAGVLEVVGERRVRGAAERTYRLRTGTTVIGPEAAAQLTVEQHRAAFAAFAAGLLADFDRYLARGDVDLGRDLVGYRQAVLHLTDDELTELITELRELVARRMSLPPEGRTRRLLSTVLMPAD
ncbi:helix-turn-helix domain-containing protein [Actinoplanes sp. NPDC049316]|uniref:helix-turn-helix domain-containing protein n=1 Tax=Actinoplanes sp. NPDC049316 TaxID=3154727 RepID=UPI00344258D5